MKELSQQFLSVGESTAVSSGVGVSPYTNYFATESLGLSLSEVLNYYGFTSTQQKLALQSLLQQSSIIDKEMSLENAFPARKTTTEIVQDLIKLMQELQNKFIVRTGSQERWEIKALDWMQQNQEYNLSHLKVLGFVDTLSPKQQEVDAICILGATSTCMSGRIEYTHHLLQSGCKATSIILLAGERYVSENIDGTPEELMHIANKFHLQDWHQLTETHLIQDLYNKSTLHDKNLPVHVIDTPKGSLPRPTTYTTVLELILWLQKSHTAMHSILFISNQPYVQYQAAIINLIFKEQHVDLQYEVVGAVPKRPEDLKPIFESLGSYMWAALPQVLSDMKISITDITHKEALRELCAKNPLVYNSLPQSFSK